MVALTPLNVRPQLAPRRTIAPLAAAEAAENAETAAQPTKPTFVTPAWQAAIDLLNSGEVLDTVITAVNKSGVVIEVGKLQGFVPYKLMNRARIEGVKDEGEDGASFRQKMVGQSISVKVTQVVVPERRLICSEKMALLDKLAGNVKPGEVVTGRVSSLHDFGAFVEIIEPEEFQGAEVRHC